LETQNLIGVLPQLYLRMEPPMNNRIVENGLNLAALLIVMVGVMFAAQSAFVV